MSRKQLVGVMGAGAGCAVAVLVYIRAAALFAGVALPSNDPASRLAFAWHWLLLPGLTLLAGVWAAGRRGFYRDAIDGSRTPANHGLEINLRYNTNTVEQIVLAATAWSGLALALPHAKLVLIPAMACLFAVGRIAFWIGYLIYPTGRAFGMVLTIVPTIAAYGWLGWAMFVR